MKALFFISKAGSLIFSYGGIGFSIYALLSIKEKRETDAKVDLKKFRIAMFSLIVFIVLSTMSSQHTFEIVFGSYDMQSINDLMAGISFTFFLWRLWKSIVFQSK